MERTVAVRLKAAVGNYLASMQQAAAATRQVRKEISQTARTSKADMQTVGTAMTVAGGAMVGAVAMAGRSAIQFESSFAGIRKTVNASETEFAALASGMRDLSRSIPTNVNELNAIGESAGQLGIAKENILGFTRTMADLGETTNLSSEQAATSLARFANIVGTSQTDFDRLGSTIVALGNNFATTESEIVDMAMRVAGAGAQVGMTEAQILAMSAALSSVGINAEAGGTAISKVMIDIASEVANGGDKLAQFAAVSGMTVQDFRRQWEEDAAGALGAFITGLGNLDEQGGSTLQVLEELEITEVRMRDALLRASGAGELWAKTGDTANVAWAENVALAKEAAQRYDTVESRIKIAGNAINDAGITLGQVYAPAVGAAADATAGLAGFIADLPGPAAAAVTGVAGLGGAATLAAGGFLLAAPRIVATKDALNALALTSPRAVGALRGVGSILMGGWGIALAGAITAVGLFARAKGEAARKVEAFIDTLDEETGALTENTRAHALSRMETEGMIDDARTLGISLQDLTDAVLGDESAWRRVRSAMDEANESLKGTGDEMVYDVKRKADVEDATRDLTTAMGGLNRDLEQSQAEFRESAIIAAEAEGKFFDVAHAVEAGNSRLEAGFIIMGQTRAEAPKAARALGPLSEGYEAVGEEAETATEKIQRFNDHVRAQFDPIFAVANALQEVADAEAALAEARAGSVGEGGTFATEAEKAQAVAEALDDQVRAAMSADAAMRELEAAMADGSISTQGAIRMMEGWISQGWLSREAADAFLVKIGEVHGELDDMTSQIWNLQVVADISGAEEDIRRLAGMLTAVTGTKYVHVEGSRATVVPRGVNRDDYHSGGWAGRDGTPHRGPMRQDEVPAVLQHGEFTLDRPGAAAMNAAGLLPTDGRTTQDIITDVRDGRASVSMSPTVHVAGGGGGGSSRTFQVAKGAVQVTAPDSRRAGAESAFQLDRLVREMGG